MSEPARKKRRTNNNNLWDINRFAETEAEEGGHESEEDDYDVEEGEDIREVERHERDVSRRMANKSFDSVGNETPRRNQFASMVNALEQRYANNAGHESEYDDSPMQNYNDDVSSMGAAPVTRPNRSYASSTMADIGPEMDLPTIQDPHLFLVPCLVGKERIVVRQLLRKYFTYKHVPTKQLFIKTAFTTDQNTGHIYVEADKEIHVKRSCEGIFGLNLWKIKMVPRTEMVASLSIKSDMPEVRRGQWCRVMGGMYRDDLAQVYDTSDQGSKVVLRMLPRIDYSRAVRRSDEEQQGDGKTVFNRPSGYRPPQRLFAESDFANAQRGKFPRVGWECITYKGRYFKDGYELKTMPVGKVNFDVTATSDEVAKLRKPTARRTSDDGDEDDEEEEEERESIEWSLRHAPLPHIPQVCNFVRGDTVKVVKGGLVNLVGEVVSTQRNTANNTVQVTVLPDHKELRKPIPFDAEHLVKYFKVGCHVKVTKGQYQDETGLIVKVSEDKNQVALFSDLTAREITVSMADITETSEVSSGVDVLANYSLYELVQLTRDVVGVIVGIQVGTFMILNNKGEVSTCRLQDIARHNKDDFAVALDEFNNQVRLNDVVVPQLGEFKGQRVTVKHIYRAVLFCHSNSCTANNHIFVIRARLCRLAGGRRGRPGAGQLTARTDTSNEKKLRLMQSRRRDPWLGKTIKIKKGAWKGYIGIVKFCTDNNLRVELHAKKKTVNMKRDDVRVLNPDGSEVSENMHYNYGTGYGSTPRRSQFDGNNRGGGGGGDRVGSSSQEQYLPVSSTPNYMAAQTPLIGATTPGYNASGIPDGARTPAVGSMTPAMGSHTPFGGDFTPAYGGNFTPHREGAGAWDPGSQTPAVGAMTPASPAYGYGRSTPNDAFHTPRADSLHSPNDHMSYGEYGHDTPRRFGASPASSRTDNMSMTSPSMSASVQHTPSHQHSSQMADEMQSTDELHSNGNATANASQSMDRGGAVGNEDGNESSSGSQSDSGQTRARPTPFYFVIPRALLQLEDGREVEVIQVFSAEQTAQIRVVETKKMLSVHLSMLKLQKPEPNDHICVVSGNFAGEEGEVIVIDEEEVIVQLSGENVQFLLPDQVVKLTPNASD